MCVQEGLHRGAKRGLHVLFRGGHVSLSGSQATGQRGKGRKEKRRGIVALCVTVSVVLCSPECDLIPTLITPHRRNRVCASENVTSECLGPQTYIFSILEHSPHLQTNAKG